MKQKTLDLYLELPQGKAKGNLFCIFCSEMGKSFETDSPSELLEHEMKVHGLPRDQTLAEREDLLKRIEAKTKEKENSETEWEEDDPCKGCPLFPECSKDWDNVYCDALYIINPVYFCPIHKIKLTSGLYCVDCKKRYLESECIVREHDE